MTNLEHIRPFQLTNLQSFLFPTPTKYLRTGTSMENQKLHMITTWKYEKLQTETFFILKRKPCKLR